MLVVLINTSQNKCLCVVVFYFHPFNYNSYNGGVDKSLQIFELPIPGVSQVQIKFYQQAEKARVNLVLLALSVCYSLEEILRQIHRIEYFSLCTPNYVSYRKYEENIAQRGGLIAKSSFNEIQFQPKYSLFFNTDFSTYTSSSYF